MIDSPIFLVDADGADTTLLRLMLNNHPQVTWLHELEYASQVHTSQTHTSQISIGHNLTYPELVSSLLAQQKTAAGQTLIRTSNTNLRQHFNQLLTRWPQAKFIHILRDPREVACAGVRQGKTGNVWAGLDPWIEAEATWDKISPQLSTKETLEIGYQDLIVDTHSTLDKVCNFIGVTYSPAMMDKVQTPPQSTNPRLLYPQPAQGWQRLLSKREIQLIEARIGSKMVARGFAYSGFAKRKVSPWKRIYLRAQNGLARVSFRIKRYGLRLFLGDFITRKLGSRRLNRTYRQKITQIQLSQFEKSW